MTKGIRFAGCSFTLERRHGAVVLAKTAVGTTKTEGGITYRLNQNHRWEKVEGAAAPGQLGLFDLPVVQNEPAPTPHQDWDNDPLSGVTPQAVLRLDSDDAKRFEKFLVDSTDPTMLLEMIVPANWSTSNLQQQQKEAKEAIALFVELGISEADAIYDLSDQLGDVFRGKLPPPQDQFFRPAYDAIAGVAAGFEELQSSFDTDPKLLAWEFATEYDGKRGLMEQRRDLEADLAAETDPIGRRESELHIALVDRVLEDFPTINKALKTLNSLEDKLPEAFWEFGDVDTAIAQSKLCEAALHPTARQIGKLFEDAESEEAENAIDYYWAKVEAAQAEEGNP